MPGNEFSNLNGGRYGLSRKNIFYLGTKNNFSMYVKRKSEKTYKKDLTNKEKRLAGEMNPM